MQNTNKKFPIRNDPSQEEIKLVREGLANHTRSFPNGELDIPSPDISLVLKDQKGTIIGGVITSMLTGIMHLEILWVDEKYRGFGYGKALVLEAEKIGKKKGYQASQTWTFSFQAPAFYQSIGYKVLGVFDGYTDGITEFVLLKKFKKDEKTQSEADVRNQKGLIISEDKSENSMKILHKGLHQFVMKQIGELREKNAEININLVIKNENNQVIAGASAYTTLKVVHTVVIWVDEKYHHQGYGKELLTTIELIAKKNGCISGLVNALSFQSPDFFEKYGYEVFGVSDGYSDSVREFFLKKNF